MRTVSRDRPGPGPDPAGLPLRVISKAIAGAKDAAVDDLALVEASGASVVLTPGRAELMKITHPEDFAMAEKLISGPGYARRYGL